MPKYCINCGRYIEDNQTCVCSLNNTEPFYPNNTNANVNRSQSENLYPNNNQRPSVNLYGKPRNASEFIDSLLSIIKSFVKNPANTVQTVALEKKLYPALSFLILQSIVLCFFNVFYTYTAFSSIGIIDPHAGISLFKVFLISFVVIIFQTGLMALFFKVSSKSKNNFLSLSTAMGLLSIPITAALVISFPLVLIPFLPFRFAGFFLIFLSIMFSSLIGIDILKNHLSIKQNISQYISILALSAYYFITICLAFHMFFF